MGKIAEQIAANPPNDWTPRPYLLCAAPIPLPMHGLAPRVVLGSRWWDKERQAAYRSTNFHCIACCIARGTKWCEWLEGHEVYDVDYLLGRMVYLETVPLCYRCHSFVHPGFLRIKLEEGIVSREEFETILNHGYEVIARAGAKREREQCHQFVEWSAWRLVVAGKEYAPLYQSFEQYKKEFGQ